MSEVIPFPTAAPPVAVADATEITPDLQVVLYSDGCGGVLVHGVPFAAQELGGDLSVIAVPLDVDELEAAGHALLAYAAQLKARG